MRLLIDEDKLARSAREAATDDLLDRVTAYRPGLEPVAVAIFEDELRRRKVTRQDIDAHAEACRRECLLHADGTAVMCSYCRRPAVARGLGWLRLLRFVPLLPWPRSFCKAHRPGATPS